MVLSGLSVLIIPSVEIGRHPVTWSTIFIMSEKTILAVLAHPDDESFGMGGTLALYAERGVNVYLVCATRGEVGEAPPELMKGYSSVAELREAELRCAAGKLGLKDVFFLNYRDSGMPGSPDNSHPRALAAQPLDEVAENVACYIRKLQPQVILTFDPIGGYRHPDHIAIQRATVKAFEMAADPGIITENLPPYTPQRLYFHVFPKGFLKFAVKLYSLMGKDPHKFGVNGDIDMVAISQVEFPTHARINISRVAGKKQKAGACHASQGGGRMGGGIITFFTRMLDTHESFMRADPPAKKEGKFKRDLFD